MSRNADMENTQVVKNSYRNDVEASGSPALNETYEGTTEANESFVSRRDAAQQQQHESQRSMGGHVHQVMSLLSFFLPHADPVPWDKFFVMVFFIILPCLSYIFFFTKMGIGLSTFYYVSENYEDMAPVIVGGLAAFMFVLNLMDFTYWNSKWGLRVQMICWAIFVAGLIFFILCVAAKYPYGPISVFAVVTPLWLLTVKSIFYPHIEIRRYIRWLSFPFFLVSILTGICWFLWTFWLPENEWNMANRLADAEKSGCEPNFQDYPWCRKFGAPDEVCFDVSSIPKEEQSFSAGCPVTCENVYNDCLNTFILWVGPLMVSFSLFFFSFFCTFLRTSHDGSTEKDVYNFGKLWILLLFAVWVTASYAGVGQGLTSTLASLTLAGFVGSMVFLSKVLSKHEAEEQVMGIMESLRDKYGGYVDFARGLFLIACGPLCIPYLMMSVCIQLVRRSGCFIWSHPVGNNDGYDDVGRGKTGRLDCILTEETQQALHSFREWDRVKVYTYAIYWGMAMLTLQVFVTKFMTIFFSWLIVATQSMNLLAVTGIMIAVGLVLFLLPPIPGAPIYLTLGIVSIAVGRPQLGVLFAILYAIGVSLFIKLLACAAQQKLIGELLSNSVSTRQFCQINSNVIRAMKLVLGQKGMGTAKVAILVGGPDWPTSVLCGLMKLDLLPILVGTLPVVFLIIPTTLSGAFTYMSSLKLQNGNDEFPWAGTTTTVTLAIAAVVQFCSFLFACLFIENITATRLDELEAMPVDKEVEEADKQVETAAKAYEEVTKWEVVPIWARFLLSLGVACMIGSCYLVQLFQTLCFQEFELTSTIEEDLDGNWLNVVLPLGWVVLILFAASCLLFTIFSMWAGRKAKNLPIADIQDARDDQFVFKAPGSMRVMYGVTDDLSS